MIYSLQPEAAKELEDAFTFYREQGGNGLAHAFLAEFERVAAASIQSRFRHSQHRRQTQLSTPAFSVFPDLSSHDRKYSHPRGGSSTPDALVIGGVGRRRSARGGPAVLVFCRKDFRDIRIDDDPMVTAKGCQQLMRGVPVDADWIEGLTWGKGTVTGPQRKVRIVAAAFGEG